MSTLENYQTAKKQLFESLAIIDTYVEGLRRPQELTSSDWIELKASRGVFVKNVSLRRPDTFAIVLVHGEKGAQENKHKVGDTVEIHVITGKVSFNHLEFKAGDRLKIPASQEYDFKFIEDSYLTAKFIPKNKENFNYGPNYSTENQSSTPEIEGRSIADSQRD